MQGLAAARAAGIVEAESIVPPRPLNLLLLCDYRVDGAQTVLDHIDALVGQSGHHVLMLSMLGELPDALELERFDGIVIHYSLIISNDAYLAPAARDRIRNYSGLKGVFIQDEYRWVNRTCDALRHLGADVLFTCVPEDEIEKVYPAERLPNLSKVNVLTGYVPAALLSRPLRPYSERKIDVGYRARRLSAFYGELAREKWLIGERFAADAPRYGLRCDLSSKEHERLYGEAWIEFLCDCKAVLGVESGASVFDFTGEIQREVEEYERNQPNAKFEEIRDKFFPGLDGLIRLNQISPRCFEAAALGTLMVLYEGDYSGVLTAGKHYVALKKDHSNMADVVAVLRDEQAWNRITRAAFDEIACNEAWGYPAFAMRVGRALAERAVKKGVTSQSRRPYSAQEFASLTQIHRVQMAKLSARRARSNGLFWRLVTAFAERGPVWLVGPIRAVWRALRYGNAGERRA